MEWDSIGRLWMVTDKGLMRYDGYKPTFFEHLKENQNSPLSTDVRSLLKVTENEFWISYNDRGDLSYFDPISNKYSHIKTDTLNTPGFPYIMSTKILFESDSIRWIMTWGQGLIRYNIKTGAWKQFYDPDNNYQPGEPPVNRIKDMFRWDDEHYFVSFFLEQTNCTPHLFNPTTGKFSLFDLTPFLDDLDPELARLISKAATMVHFLYPDSHDQIWIGSYIGLVCLDLKNKTAQRVTGSSNDIYRQNIENTRNYVVDDKGILWVSTFNQGIMCVNPITKKVTYLRHSMNNDQSVADDRITTIAKDKFGNIWTGTNSGNISVCHTLVQNFIIHEWNKMGLEFSNRSQQEIPVNQILVQPNGHIYISNANGILEYNAPESSFTEFRIEKKLVKNIGQWDRGIEYFRHYNNHLFYRVIQPSRKQMVIKFNLSTKKWIEIGDFHGNDFIPLFRHSISDQELVVSLGSTRSSLIKFNLENNTVDTLTVFPEGERIKENFTLTMEDSSWIVPTNQKKLARFFPEEKRLIHYDTDSGEYIFPDSVFNCAIIDKDGDTWLGSNSGIYKQERAGTVFKKCNQITGLKENETVNSIYQDSTGNFWIATIRELIHWNVKEKSFYRFNESHGLRVGNFLPAVTQADTLGNVYIATYHGILQFNPYELSLPGHKIHVYLAESYLNDELITESNFFSKDRVLSPDENYLTFEMHTNEVFPIAPTKFYYKLTGRDNHWIENGESNKIRLEDLSYGQYVLQIKAINIFNKESEILEIPITIDKPFYLKWWFIVLILLISVCVVWWYIRLREKLLRQKSIQLERTVTERTADVVREKEEADKQRREAEHQKVIVEEKQKEISDSITYAKRIQSAILPSNRYFNSVLKQSFILYLPKDIVAGDFYFLEKVDDQIIIGVADCTGHGVPGAMVSVVCHNALNRSVKEFGLTAPEQILDKTRELIIETF
ncbi:MAG: hypothetical protein JNJ99_03145, partial [Crocinitomicaceae bacterium]|nr:hypothetical protein [Crocinitomicaceae bacterium]